MLTRETSNDAGPRQRYGVLACLHGRVCTHVLV